MIIDAHTHIGRKMGSEKLTFEKALKLLLGEMRSNKVDHSIVIASYKRTSFNPSMAEDLALVKGIKKLSLVGSLDVLHYTQKDLYILEELLSKKIIKGIKIHLGYQYIYANDPRCNPIYRLCLKHDAPVIFHTGDTLTIPGEKPAKVKYAHPLPIDDEVVYKNNNVYADISGIVINDADLYSPYGDLVRKKIQEIFHYSDPKKLLYGTDWPLASMKSYIKFTKSLRIAKKDLDYVFYKNAQTLFKL